MGKFNSEPSVTENYRTITAETVFVHVVLPLLLPHKYLTHTLFLSDINATENEHGLE